MIFPLPEMTFPELIGGREVLVMVTTPLSMTLMPAKKSELPLTVAPASTVTAPFTAEPRVPISMLDVASRAKKPAFTTLPAWACELTLATRLPLNAPPTVSVPVASVTPLPGPTAPLTVRVPPATKMELDASIDTLAAVTLPPVPIRN